MCVKAGMWLRWLFKVFKPDSSDFQTYRESACQCRRHRRQRFDPGVRKTPGAGKPMDGKVYWAVEHGVIKSQTWPRTHACILQKQYGKKLCLRTRACQISLALTWIKTHFTLKGERLKGMQMAWTKNSHLVQFAQGDRLGNPQGNKSWAIEANGHCCKAQ